MKYTGGTILLLLSLTGVFSSKEDVGSTNEKTTELYRDPRMTGGYWAKKGQFPYHVSILIDDLFVCGGGLIKKNYVLTAAHCVVDKNLKFTDTNAKVWFGVTAIYGDNKNSKIEVEVEKVFVPKKYLAKRRGWFHDGDIAILKLKPNKAILDKWILQLPLNKDYVGTEATVVGSGINKISKETKLGISGGVETLDGILRYNQFKVIKNKDCKEEYGHDEFPANLICVKTQKGRHGSVCEGDSGGSLVHDNRILGVLSVGSPKCDSEFPEIFTRVSKYLDFINKVTSNKIDSSIASHTPAKIRKNIFPPLNSKNPFQDISKIPGFSNFPPSFPPSSIDSNKFLEKPKNPNFFGYQGNAPPPKFTDSLFEHQKNPNYFSYQTDPPPKITNPFLENGYSFPYVPSSKR